MSILSGPTKIAFGFGLGVMAAGLVKNASPAFKGLGKPLLKAGVKASLILARDSRVKLAEMRETLADVTAEAERELRDARLEVAATQAFADHPKQEADVM